MNTKKNKIYEEQSKYAKKFFEKEGNISQEEEQRRFAKQCIELERKYGLEEQEEYMNEIAKRFMKGEISKKHLNEILQELKKYPDKAKSMIFINDIQTKLNGNIGEAIETLENYGEDSELIQEEINRYKMIEKYNQEEINIEKEKELRRKENLKKQREYSREIVQRLVNGKITKQEIPEIQKKLELYPDRVRAIFLIVKIYEIVEGRNEALKNLAKYTKIQDLTPDEREIFVNMDNIIKHRQRYEESTTQKSRIIYEKIEQKEKKEQIKQEQRDFIEESVQKGKNIEKIKILMKNKWPNITVDQIRKIRDDIYKEDENYRKKLEDTKNVAIELLKQGYSEDDVYKLVENEISKKEIRQLLSRLKEEER